MLILIVRSNYQTISNTLEKYIKEKINKDYFQPVYFYIYFFQFRFISSYICYFFTNCKIMLRILFIKLKPYSIILIKHMTGREQLLSAAI